MDHYKNAHRWLMLAFVIVMLGFARSYWSRFPFVDFMHHLHMLFATAWFALLVWQPRLATTGRLRQHRRTGMIGLFLAGGVVGTSLLMLPANIENGANGVGGGFVDPTFFYGITFFDLVSISGFTMAVLMAILTAKRPVEHGLWMMTTAFWIIGPAFARLMVLPVIMVFGRENLNFFDVINLAMGIVLMAILVTAWRLHSRHLSLLLVFLGMSLTYLSEPLGASDAWRSLMNAVFLPPAG